MDSKSTFFHFAYMTYFISVSLQAGILLTSNNFYG